LDLKKLIDIVLHLDKYLTDLTAQYGAWTIAILCLIVFCETGLVVTPFLPGDSLLFAAGAVSSLGNLNPLLLAGGMIVSAILGDTVNYHVGKAIGPRVMKSEKSWLFNKKHLDKTHRFFEKYGGRAVIFARFVPIVRTFAPFVAGAGAMNYRKFIIYNVTGAIAWVVLMFGAGYFFGQTEFVKKNFHRVIVAIIILSIMPGVIEFLKEKYGNKGDKADSDGSEAAAKAAKTEKSEKEAAS
jgi:membrane-associated protein